MPMHTIRLALALSVAACAADDPDVGVAAFCNSSFCGGNSPEIGHHGLHELHLDHKANAEGFRYLGITKDAEIYELAVTDGRFVATRPGHALVGEDLIGAILWIDHDDGRQYGIAISRVGQIAEVVAPYDPIETYFLEWSPVIGRPLAGPIHVKHAFEAPVLETGASAPVCPDPFDAGWDGRIEWDETAGMTAYESLVFEGDRIDAVRRTVDPVPDDRWFNIGCGAHTLAKLRLTRSTIHTGAAWEREQATLKMLSGDYCGTGAAFTVAGEPLVWRNAAGMSFLRDPFTLDARWNAAGALCVHEPRLVETGSELAHLQFPDVWLAMEEECGRVGRPLVKCDDADPTQQEFPDELITSGNR